MKQQAASGFTVIELLTVITIIGALAAIAIPSFNHYRNRSRDSVALSDLRSMATIQEAVFASNGAYASCASAEDCHAGLSAFRASPGVLISVITSNGPTPGFQIQSQHEKGTGRIFVWDSSNGGLQN